MQRDGGPDPTKYPIRESDRRPKKKQERIKTGDAIPTLPLCTTTGQGDSTRHHKLQAGEPRVTGVEARPPKSTAQYGGIAMSTTKSCLSAARAARRVASDVWDWRAEERAGIPQMTVPRPAFLQNGYRAVPALIPGVTARRGQLRPTLAHTCRIDRL